MRALHLLNAGLWTCNVAVWIIYAHSVGGAFLATCGVLVSVIMWWQEPR